MTGSPAFGRKGARDRVEWLLSTALTAQGDAWVIPTDNSGSTALTIETRVRSFGYGRWPGLVRRLSLDGRANRMYGVEGSTGPVPLNGTFGTTKLNGSTDRVRVQGRY